MTKYGEAVVGSVVLNMTCYQKKKYDIVNQAYIIYNESFTVEDYKKEGSVPLYILG